MRQQDIVLMHLKSQKTITSWDAIKYYGITRLAEMIRRLKKDGHKIVTITKTGNHTHYAEYKLEKK
jgi:hypothetical protein